MYGSANVHKARSLINVIRPFGSVSAYHHNAFRSSCVITAISTAPTVRRGLDFVPIMSTDHVCPTDPDSPAFRYSIFCPRHCAQTPPADHLSTSIPMIRADESRNRSKELRTIVGLRKQNVLLPIGKLPDEVLFNIFAFCGCSKSREPHKEWFDFS